MGGEAASRHELQFVHFVCPPVPTGGLAACALQPRWPSLTASDLVRQSSRATSRILNIFQGEKKNRFLGPGFNNDLFGPNKSFFNPPEAKTICWARTYRFLARLLCFNEYP